MFRVTIDDVLKIRDVVAISGTCVNKGDFSQTLFDERGVEYEAQIPFIKHVTPPNPDYITLELRGVGDHTALKGQTLRSVV